MTREQYLKLRGELERKIQALDTVWGMLQSDAAPAPRSKPAPVSAAGSGTVAPAPLPFEPPADGEATPSIRQAARDAIKTLPQDQPFTLRDVHAALAPRLNAQMTKEQISIALVRLAARHEIELIAPAAGTRPAQYQRNGQL